MIYYIICSHDSYRLDLYVILLTILLIVLYLLKLLFCSYDNVKVIFYMGFHTINLSICKTVSRCYIQIIMSIILITVKYHFPAF